MANCIFAQTSDIKHELNIHIHTMSYCHLQARRFLFSTMKSFSCASIALICLSPFLWSFSRWNWLSQNQNVSILDFIGAKDDGGGNNWSYKTCKAPVKMSPATKQYSVFLHVRCPSCCPTNSAEALKGSTAGRGFNKIPIWHTEVIAVNSQCLRSVACIK